MAFFYLLIFGLGLIVGSFLNCVIYRLELSEESQSSRHKTALSFLYGRSFCPHCKRALNWVDLIPILSFLILKGKCRYCQKPISWQYPLVEISTAILFLLLSVDRGIASIYAGDVFLYWVMACFLIIIFVYDLKHYIIPDEIVFSAIALALLYLFFETYGGLGGLMPALFSAIGASAFFLLIVLVSRGRWMGIGDIKLAFLMGLILGWPNILVALFSAFFLGAAIGLVLIALGKKQMSSEVPFGPFLITGTFLAIFWGERLVNWYSNFFLY